MLISRGSHGENTLPHELWVHPGENITNKRLLIQHIIQSNKQSRCVSRSRSVTTTRLDCNLEVGKIHFNYNIALVFSLPEYQPNFAGQINNVTATIGEDIVLNCRVKNVTRHGVNKYMYFIMEYCLLILRLISQVDWMLLDYRSFPSTLELLQGRGSILTMGNFKMTFNARIDIDHEEDTSSGTR